MWPTRIAAAVVTLAAAATLSACGGSVPAADDQPAPPAPAQPDEGDVDEAGQFLGLTVEEASALAARQGRGWRVSREDGEQFALTADFVEARVTFEVDGGVVTAAFVEREAEAAPPPLEPGDAGRAELLARAVERLVTVDNSFGGGDPFDQIQVATVIGGDVEQPVEPLARELIAASLGPLARVEFISDAQAAIDRHFESQTGGVAVVTIDEIRIDGTRAEVDLGLWCGSLCGVWLTYEASLGPNGWEILGPTGPIAVS